MKKLCHLLLYIWSLSPIFALTCDRNYGTNENGITEDLRFSVLNIMLGTTTYYFLTTPIKSNKSKLKFKHKLTMLECQNMAFSPEDIDISKKANDYITHLNAISEEDRDIEKEFTIYLIQNEISRIDVAFNKMNFYTGIILVFIPLVFSVLNALGIDTLVPSMKTITFCFLGVLFYSLLNWLLYTIQYMQVSGHIKSTFNSLKNPPNGMSRSKLLMKNYYFDWQTIRNEATFRVSFVVNTERWVKWSIGIFIVLMLFVASVTSMNNISDSSSKNLRSEPQLLVYTMKLHQLEEPFSQDSLTLSEVHVEIKKCRVKKIFVLTDGKSQKFDFIKSQFKQYGDEINVIFYTDTTLGLDDLKIILDGGS